MKLFYITQYFLKKSTELKNKYEKISYVIVYDYYIMYKPQYAKWIR